MATLGGTIHKVIVTLVILGVLDFLHLAKCSAPPTAPLSVQNQMMYDVSPSATSHVLFSSPPRNMDVAESGSFFSDGALSSHPLHGLSFSSPGLTGFMNIRGGHYNPFIRSSAGSGPSSGDILQTAAQTYFIEPVQPTTTTQRPTFKKRKTRRPISVLAEQSKKQKESQSYNDNSANEVTQGNPVPFNPFRQIVNTSFGRSRPSDSKLGRSRSRPGAAGAKQETGSAAVTDTNNKDSLNEIPSTSTEGEPRVLGQRRKPQDVRPLRPTSSLSPLSTTQNNENGEGNNGEFFRELPKPRRFNPRPRPGRPQQSDQSSNNNENNDSAGDDTTSAPPSLPPRPRNLSRRPRPTTTFASTDDLTEYTPGITTSQTQPQTQPPQTQPPQPTTTTQQQTQEQSRRPRPGRPLGGGGARFGGGRLTLSTTPLPDPDIDAPPAQSRPRRPVRPTTSTTQQASNPSTAAPGRGRLPQSPASNQDVPRTQPRPAHGERQGFILRPRPTSSSTTQESDGENESEGGATTRPLNRRRKRPTTTTTVETPRRPNQRTPAVNYNQQFTGGIVQQNEQRSAGNTRNQNEENIVPGRRVPQVVRTRPSPFSNSEQQPPSYQIQEEQPFIQSILRGQHESLRNPIPEEQPNPGNPTVNSASLLRRPAGLATGPSAPSVNQPNPIQQLQQNYPNNQQALTGPNNFVNSGLYNFPSQDTLGFYPGYDNVLGVSSNLKTVQESPKLNQLKSNQFSARTTASADEPEISDNDSTPDASPSDDTPPSSSGSTPNPLSGESESLENTKPDQPTTPPKKLSPLERLQQNRQEAARRLLNSKKPTEKSTSAPQTASQTPKSGKSLRKSVIPPRMLRPRGKLFQKDEEAPQEKNNEEEKSIENTNGDVNNESSSNSASSSIEPDTDQNDVPISATNPKTEEQQPETSSRKPSLLENAMRRRIPLPGKNSPLNKNPSQEKMSIAPPTPSPDAPPPNCEDGQRYSKFLKKCVTMYKPKSG